MLARTDNSPKQFVHSFLSDEPLKIVFFWRNLQFWQHFFEPICFKILISKLHVLDLLKGAQLAKISPQIRLIMQRTCKNMRIFDWM